MSSHVFRVADALAVLGAAFAERTIAINAQGDRIGYRQWGERGPLVVLLHGISSSAASWLPCARVLSQTMRVLAWDAPGYGNSTPLEQAEPRAADYALRLRAWLSALQVKPDVIVGHSLGALMASAYVAEAPAAMQPNSLLLLNPAQGYGQPGQEEKSRTVQAQRLATLDKLGIDGMAESRHAHLLRPDASDEERAWVRWNMARLNATAWRCSAATTSAPTCASARHRRRRAWPVAMSTASRRRLVAKRWLGHSACRSRWCRQPGTRPISTRPKPLQAGSNKPYSSTGRRASKSRPPPLSILERQDV